MKILLVNQTFYPDPVATSQYLTDLALELTNKNYSVSVLAGRRGYAEPYPLYGRRETYKGIRIIRVWPHHLGRRGRLIRTLDAVLLLINFAWQVALLPKFDSVVVLTSPPLIAYVVGGIAKLKGSRVVNWVMDLNPDQAIEAEWLARDSLEAKILNNRLRYSLRRSDQIIVLDYFMKNRVLAKEKSAESKIHVVPPWALMRDPILASEGQNPFRKKHRLENKFIIMYSGNHSICHPLDTLLEGAAAVKEDPHILFLFIGGGERVKDVLEFKKKNHLDNIMFIPYVKQDQLKYSLAAADVYAVVMGNHYVGIVHPCKIYDILAVGRPFVYVGPAESHIGMMVKDYEVGVRITHGDVAGLVKTIYDFKNMSSARRNEMITAQKKVAQNYSKNILIEKMTNIITGK